MASAELSKKRKRADDDAAAAKKSKSDKKEKKEKKEKKAKAVSTEDETAPATDEFIALEESKKDKKERKRKEKEARKAAAAAEEQEEAADVSAMDVDPPADGEKKKKKDKKSKKAKTEEAEEAAAPAEEEVKEEKKSKKEKKDKKKEAKAKEEAKPETNGEEKSKKKDKKSKKTKEEPAAPAPAPAAEEQEEEPAEGGKREKYIVFVGNLPYTANKESIRAHFSAYNPSAVRCLNKDNNPNVCRGIAFLEFSNGSNMRTCLDKMHHTEFDDGLSPARRINLELSAGGGGKSKFRREKIKSRNVQLDENRVKRMQKEEEYKKQRVSEGGSNTQQDSIHPSRLALMHQ
ncbi:putative RNA-binding protein [Colletotrichum sp. SAR 10_99]|nr:putative RNA-binding protein [Colletotrichum sp. SAR 10_99]